MKLKSKLAKATILTCALAAVTAAFIVSPTVFMDGETASRAGGKAWMKALDGDKLLSQFSVPGAHNSGARFEPIRGTARCQHLTIPQQLNAGVRFLDIRCRHLNDAFAIYHGPIYQRLSFDDVLQNVFDFLAANRSETVILSVQEAQDARHNTRSFEATFDDYVAKNPSRWLLNQAIPTLGQARGKIVLLRRFDASKPIGIDASKWPDNAVFSSGHLRVQDVYQTPSIGAKWDAIVALLGETRATPIAPLTLNFTSGVQSLPLGIPSVTRVSDDINPRLAHFLAANPRGNFGCIIMDFSDSARCAAIYNSNGTL